MLDWLYTVIAWTLAQWHALLATFLDPAGGPAWVLAIVLLVITVRLLLVPLFTRQVRSQRAVQELQPEIRALRERHAGDAQRLSREVLALQQERGVNPLAGCLPSLLQVPVFLALLHVLRRLAPGADGLYGWSFQLTQQAADATLAGAPISSAFTMREPLRSAVLDQAGASDTRVQVVATVLIVAMCVTSFLTQKLTQRRAGPVEGQAATVQEVLLYGMPAGLLVTGFFFPIGVLVYWTTNNLWTLGQQLFVLRRMPPATPPVAPGHTPAPAPRPGARPANRRRRRSR